jgi:hypothetical protein
MVHELEILSADKDLIPGRGQRFFQTKELASAAK